MEERVAEERMDQGYSVFNMHINDAGERADREFVAQFGADRFRTEIEPFHDNGIMSIFHRELNIYTSAWVALVTAFVNEGRA